MAKTTKTVKTVDSLDAWKVAFSYAAQAAIANSTAKTAGTQLGESLLAIARACGTLNNWQDQLGKFQAFLLKAEGQAYQKSVGIEPAITKTGRAKLPEPFVQKASLVTRYFKASQTVKALPSLSSKDGNAFKVPTINTIRTELEAAREEIEQAKISQRKLSEEEKAAVEHEAQIMAEFRRQRSTFADRCKMLSGERIEQALALLTRLNTALLDLEVAERVARSEAEKAAKAAHDAAMEAKAAKLAAQKAIPDGEQEGEQDGVQAVEA